jgi:putative Mn2+ efflux pump MntP
MTHVEIWLLALALAMDCFAVSMASGIIFKRIIPRQMIAMVLLFGLFQALNPLLGWLGAELLRSLIENVDHWIAFVLLGFIGVNMIREALSKEEGCECECEDASLAPKVMLTMAVATSIDALAAGVGMSVDLNGMGQILFAVLMIGVITFILSMVGVKIGNVFGSKYKFIAEISGGVVLVGMGIKILVEHLFFA